MSELAVRNGDSQVFHHLGYKDPLSDRNPVADVRETFLLTNHISFIGKICSLTRKVYFVTGKRYLLTEKVYFLEGGMYLSVREVHLFDLREKCLVL